MALDYLLPFVGVWVGSYAGVFGGPGGSTVCL